MFVACKKSKKITGGIDLASLPMTCTSFGDHSEIDALIESTGQWETLATIHSVAGIDAEDIASFVVHSVSVRQKVQKILCDMTVVIGDSLAGDNLSKGGVQVVRGFLEQVHAMNVL